MKLPTPVRGRRLVLVDFCWTRAQDPRVPLGHASLLAALRRRVQGDVRSVVVPVNQGSVHPGLVVSQLLHETEGFFSADVDIAFGAYVWGEELLQRVLPLLRSRGFQGRIILGGPQISYAGAGVDKLYPQADAFVRGYGEDALTRLADDPGRPVIRGVHYAGEPDRVEQAAVDLEALPSPLLDGSVPLLGQRFVRWESQRGCPFRCSFCQHREAGARLVRRGLSDARVSDEIDLLCALAPDRIAVLDPIFNTSARATAILEQFAENGFRGELSLQCRAEYIDEAFLRVASRLKVCLEFGLQTIHDTEGDAIHRRNSLPRVEVALAAVRDLGIAHEISLIFGLPRQTLASFIESVRWCMAQQVPVIRAFPLMLLRGTDLDRDRQQWGLVEDGHSMPCVVESSTFSREDWQVMARISEALLRTEGHHPDMTALLKLAHGVNPTIANWQPRRAGNEHQEAA